MHVIICEMLCISVRDLDSDETVTLYSDADFFVISLYIYIYIYTDYLFIIIFY